MNINYKYYILLVFILWRGLAAAQSYQEQYPQASAFAAAGGQLANKSIPVRAIQKLPSARAWFTRGPRRAAEAAQPAGMAIWNILPCFAPFCANVFRQKVN
jgi:hypothetical protein